jgi:hypothetical protein
MAAGIEAFYRLGEYERDIVWRAARAGDSRLTSSLFQLYFPKLTADEIRALMRDIGQGENITSRIH